MPRAVRGVLVLLVALLPACRPPAAELALPDVRQSTSYTCSAAALLAVLAYYGVEAREDRLAKELGATPEAGAPPPALVRVARGQGLTAELREGLTVDDLRRETRAGHPVVIAIQAWRDRPRRYQDNWEDGHYVVVIGVEGDTVVVEDPSLLGSRGVLTRAELEERWHDTDGKRRYLRMGIIFGGRTPSPPPPRRPVE